MIRHPTISILRPAQLELGQLVLPIPVPLKNPSSQREPSRVIFKYPAVLYSVWVDYNGASGEVYLHVFE